MTRRRRLPIDPQALEKFGARRGDELVARDVLATYLNLAYQYVRDEEFGDALKLCDRAIEIGRSLDIQSYTGNFFWVKAEMFQRLGDLDEAMSAVDESIRMLNLGSDGMGKGSATVNSRPETSLSDALDRSNLYRAKAALHRRAGQVDAALALEARCRDLWQLWARKLPDNLFVGRQIQALDSQ